MPDFIVKSKQLGQKKSLFPNYSVNIPSYWLADGHTLKLRELIAFIVTDEVTAFNQRTQQRQLFRLLSRQEVAQQAAQGRVNPAAQLPQPQVDAETAVSTALLAFTDGLYFVFIDDLQYEDLNEPVTVAADTAVTFIRLVALAGG